MRSTIASSTAALVAKLHREPFTVGTEVGAGVEHDAVAQQRLGTVGEAEAPEVQPRQIGGLREHVVDGGEAGGQEVAEKPSVAVEHGHHRRQPVVTVLPGGAGGLHPQAADDAEQVVRLRIPPFAQRRGPMWATAHRTPARLNALVAEVSVRVRAATSGPSEAMGTWRAGS